MASNSASTAMTKSTKSTSSGTTILYARSLPAPSDRPPQACSGLLPPPPAVLDESATLTAPGPSSSQSSRIGSSQSPSTLQSAEQPSPSWTLPSSQLSPASKLPLPQVRQTLGSPVQLKGGSSTHEALHPSPLRSLPSSQTSSSAALMDPSPQ